MRGRHPKNQMVLILGAVLALAAPALADEAALAKLEKANEKKIAAMSLPAAVKKTTREQSKGASILTIAREIKNWKTVYEVAMKVEGKTKDIIISSDGKVLVVEVTIPMETVPEAVKATIDKNLGKATLVEVLSVTEGEVITHYEARVKTGKVESEIKVAPDGTFIPPDPEEE